jgi:hypothetical protein
MDVVEWSSLYSFGAVILGLADALMLLESFKGADLTQKITLKNCMKSCNLEIFFFLYFFLCLVGHGLVHF